MLLRDALPLLRLMVEMCLEISFIRVVSVNLVDIFTRIIFLN